MQNFWHRIVHKLLKLPYRLHVRTDVGAGLPVVLLHGIGSSGRVWRHVVEDLADAPVRLIALDLLGFGQSPKPTDAWVNYSAEDHARSVIYTLKKLGVKGQAMVVGHSMGCFVAVEVATLHPKLVSNLLLYEPPFYVGLPEKSTYRLRLSAYFKLFNAVLMRQPGDLEKWRRIQQLVSRRYHFELTNENWIPFERSLRNAVMRQTALDDLKRLDTPTQIVYGRLDQWVINDKKNLFFNGEAEHVSARQVTAEHHVSPRPSKMIAELIRERTA